MGRRYIEIVVLVAIFFVAAVIGGSQDGPPESEDDSTRDTVTDVAVTQTATPAVLETPGNYPGEPPRAQLPPPEKDVTVHGLYPGLYRSEVTKLLGTPVLETEKWAIFHLEGGHGVNVQFDRKGVAYWIEGSQVEVEGRVLAVAGSPLPPPYPGVIRVTADEDENALAFQLDNLKGSGSFFQLPVPGTSVHLLQFRQALKTPGLAAKVFADHPELLHSRLLPQGETPLYFAVVYDDLTLVKSLLAAGADVNDGRFQGVTPLHACRSAGMARLLLEHGATMEGTTSSGATALQRALEGEREELALFLIEKGATLDPSTGVLASAEGRLPRMVDIFLRKGEGLPPLALHAAAKGGEAAIVRRFLDLGADPNETDSRGRTSLHAAARARRKGCDRHADAVKLLLEAGADPSLQDKHGDTPLDEAKPYHHELIPLLAPGGARTHGESHRN